LEAVVEYGRGGVVKEVVQKYGKVVEEAEETLDESLRRLELWER